MRRRRLSPRVWQLTNKRVSTRIARRSLSLPFFDNDNHHFETKRQSFVAIASVADDDVDGDEAPEMWKFGNG